MALLVLSAKMNSFTLIWKLHNVSGSHKSEIAFAKFGVGLNVATHSTPMASKIKVIKIVIFVLLNTGLVSKR